LFKMLNSIIESQLQIYVGVSGGADNILYFGHKQTDKIELDLRFGNNGYRCSLIPAEGDALVFEEEVGLFHNKASFSEPYQHSMGGGHKESLIQKMTEDSKIERFVLDEMSSWKIYHFHDTSDSSKMKKTCDLHDNAFFRADASNLASYLYFLRKKHEYEYKMIVDTIRLVAPFFDDFQLRPSPFNEKSIQLEWKHKNSDSYFSANSLSDGTLRFICLAVLLLQPPDKLPRTVLLDEPELGLHPYAIAVLAGMLRAAANKTQVILATQSVTLINQSEPEDIIVTDRKNGESLFRRLGRSEMVNWLENYGLGELWEKNIFGGRP